MGRILRFGGDYGTAGSGFVSATGLIIVPLLLGGAIRGPIDWITTWQSWLPAAGLLASLALQIVMLITGQLRRRVPAAAPFAWAAYVSSDQVAIFTLVLLSRAEEQVGLYGLWAALLLYHLGGTDNFTAYERADSELWMRHLVNLLIQVGTSAYVVWVHSRGWILVPTLLVFLVGLVRYCERNAALQRSSRAGITKALTPWYKYIEFDLKGLISCGESCTRELDYLVAGAVRWYSGGTARMSSSSVRPLIKEDWQSYFVTTADIVEVIRTDDTVREWAQWLVVASAFSRAYLLRVVGLSRLEQSGATQLRSAWFRILLDRPDDWIDYIQLEQDFLYNLLYSKPPSPDGNHLIFLFRILSTIALLLSLVAVYVLANNDTWQNSEIDEVVTYVVLVVGAIAEIGYVVRLLFGKAAIVAMLVHLVKTKRANLNPAAGLRLSFGRLSYTIQKFVCVRSLRVNKWWETKIVIRKKTYITGSNWEKGRHMRRSLLNGIERYLPEFVTSKWERGWEMIRMTMLEGSDCTTILNKIEACQTAALTSLGKRIQVLAESQNKVQLNPFFCLEPALRHAFEDFYNSDWEHVLLIWWIATLKVLFLQERWNQPRRLDLSPRAESILDNWTQQAERRRLLPATTASSKPGQEDSQAQENPGNGESSVSEPEDSEAEVNPANGESSEPEHDSMAEMNRANVAETTQMEALWLMVYICHLLTTSPELLPTRLELEKRLVADDLTTRLVADNLAGARKDIRDPRVWVDRAILHYSIRPTSSHVSEASTQLALKLMVEWDDVKRWEHVKNSACHFIAVVAQASKQDEHCSKLTRGGELLTTLWILSSHLGGGSNQDQ